MTQENRSSRQAEIHITQMRRNPYLVDYQTGKIRADIQEGTQNGHNTAHLQCRRRAQGQEHILSTV